MKRNNINRRARRREASEGRGQIEESIDKMLGGFQVNQRMAGEKIMDVLPLESCEENVSRAVH